MSNKIERIVRHYVTKALTEIVKDLDKIIEQKVRVKVEQRLQLANLLSEQAPAPEPVKDVSQNLHEVYKAPELVPAQIRKKLTAEDLGIDENVWKEVYADTLSSDNPILTEKVPQPGDHPTAEKPELVSEDKMRQFGFMKDFSKHVEAFEERDKRNAPTAEDQKAQEVYQEALRKIQRNA